VLAAYSEDKCVGYAVLFPESGDIAQMAVSKDFRGKGVGSVLMKEMSKRTDRGRLAVLNVDAHSTGTIEFLKALGFKNFVGQYEMILEL
jgi:ribosomal protein S18 acetylase RimI-like enzyme